MNVLDEFLVALGFKVDETSLKKFTTAVSNVEKAVFRLGTAVTGAAAAVVAGVTVVSHQMEDLYYASQRTGATVENLMALRYAAGQIGVGAGQAQAALESFTRTLRLNPGTGALLKQLRVEGNDPTDLFRSFLGKLKQFQPYIQAQYAQLFGIDPDTLLMMEQGLDQSFKDEAEFQKRRKAFGINGDEAGRAARDFDNSIRRLLSDLSLIWVVIEEHLNPVLTPLIEKFEDWAETHAGDVAQGIADAIQKLANWLSKVDWDQTKQDLDELIGGIRTLIHELRELKNTSFSIGGSQEDWVELKNLLSTIVNTAHALKAVLHGDFKEADSFTAKALDSLNAVIDREVGVHRVNGEPVSNEAPDFSDFGKIEELPPDGGAGSDVKYSGNPDKLTVGAIVPIDDSYIDSLNRPGSIAPRGIRNNNPGNIQAGPFANAHGAIGTDGDFAIFKSMQDGIRASIDLLHNYAARGYDTIRTIISRWAPGSENDTAAYIADVAKKLGISPDQHLSGDQLDAVAPAIFGHENGKSYASLFSTARLDGKNTNLTNANLFDGVPLGGNQPRAGTNLTIESKTDIHISPGPTARETAIAVSNEQRRVNGDLVRNFAGAVT